MGSFEAFVEILGGDANIVKAQDLSDGGLAVIVARVEMVDISSLIDNFGRNNVHLYKKYGTIEIDTSKGPLMICDYTTLFK